MKNINSIYLSLLTSIILISSCQKPELHNQSYYDCDFEFLPSGGQHPKAEVYQEILDRNRKIDIVGASLMVKDKDGIWIGTSGKADIASDINVVPCHRFLIASISKVFTATCVFSYVDKGILSLEDPVNKWVPNSITNRIENCNESNIKHLLAHTSGIPDYYTVQYELDRINKHNNNWQQEDVLEYTYGRKATHEVGASYYYSNTNFLLLGMILEQASKKSLAEVYNDEVFIPASLTSAWYNTMKPIPDGTVKGYVDIYGNGQFVESEFLYKDELNTADGGIAINAYDLGILFEKLMKGNLISEASLNKMTDWFDLPEGWVDNDIGHFKNGFGLEYNKTKYGNSVGHTGGIDGFLSIAQYFPEQDATFILLVNCGSYDGTTRLSIYNECLDEMFE